MMLPFHALALLLVLARAEATIFLANVTGPISGLPAICISVLNQAVACDEALTNVNAYRFESDASLAKVCVDTCATSLSTYTRRVTQACGSTFWAKDPDGYSYSLLYKAQLYTEKYNLVCLKGSTGAFCNAEIRNQFHIDPDSQQMTSDPSFSVTCGDCFISAMKTQLQMPIASSSDLASTFSSVTSACSKTGFRPTSPATPKTSFIVSPTATSGSSPRPTCVGKSYTVKTGDTCQSISQANGFSTAQLMAKNGLLGYCQTLPAAGTTLCLPDSLRCTTHKLVNTDTCVSLAQRYNATWVKMASWNPELGTYCDRIPKLASYGFYICVSTPGGEWVHPNPENEPPVTTSSTTDTYFTIPGTAFTALPEPTRDPDQPNLAWVPVYGEGTREDCDVYMTPPIIWNDTLDYTCASTAQAYHVPLADFRSWNTALQNQTDTDCNLSPDEQYCVQFKRLQPTTGPGVTEYCGRYQVAEPGSYDYGDCDSYLESFNISQAVFKEWNGVGCDGFQSGYAYCAVAMHFRPAGQIATCTYWAMANATGRAGCAQYVSRFGIAQARLLAWNPSLKSDCSGMVKFYDYCIGTPTWQPA